MADGENCCEIIFRCFRQRSEYGDVLPWRESAAEIDRIVCEEQLQYGDIELLDAQEGKYTLALKRFMAIKWVSICNRWLGRGSDVAFFPGRTSPAERVRLSLHS